MTPEAVGEILKQIGPHVLYRCLEREDGVIHSFIISEVPTTSGGWHTRKSAMLAFNAESNNGDIPTSEAEVYAALPEGRARYSGAH